MAGVTVCTAAVTATMYFGSGFFRQVAGWSLRLQFPAAQPSYVTGIQIHRPSHADKEQPSISYPNTGGQAIQPSVGDGVEWVQFDIPEPQTPPPEALDGGKIKEMQMTGGREEVDGVCYNDRSGRESVDMQAALQTDLTLKLHGDAPLVLLMHTHTTESYMAYDAGYYNKSDPSRTTNEKENVVAIGEMMAQQLQAAGIPVLHDTTVHDQPYSGAYGRSLKTVQSILKQYPSIQVVIDVHRDGVMADETTKVKPTVKINGEKVAQVMLLVGLNDTKSVPNPNWPNNLAMAAQLQQFADASKDGLMRPMVLRDGRFNQHTAPYCFLVEMGSDSNTLSEAMRAADLFGQRLALFLREELKKG